jgi:hypothetical protein
MGNPLLAGRDIAWQDIYNKAPVMIISETLAREYWKEPPKALGRRIRESPKAPWREIIGVVANEYDDGVNQKPTSVVYWPMLIDKYWGGQVFGQRTMAFAVRSSRVGVAGFFKEIQKAVWAVNPNLPLAAVRPLKQIHEDSMARTSFAMTMLGIAAAVALLLSLVGIYGVISYSVSQRTREIGVRMALGAQPAAVRALFLRHGFLLTSAGLVVGMAAGGALTRLMSALLFGISPLDLVTFTTVAAVLGLAAVLACYLPAQRASGVNPIEALRSE